MIKIDNKEQCCGCTACVARCPKQCIAMVEDNEGFLYPKVDLDNCIECGLCEKVCPVINQPESTQPLNIYAAKNKNEEIRRESSSGGVFTLLAEEIINQGGVVFGAIFNDQWEVVHSYTDTIDGLAAFRGSKYVQSKIGNSYKETLDFLKSGRNVLFSGTPCQIAGLKRFLGKDYDNLLTVDFICHGVPSPKVWRKYLEHLQSTPPILKMLIFKKLALEIKQRVGCDSVCRSSLNEVKYNSIKFRDKLNSWKRYNFTVKTSRKNSDTMQQHKKEYVFSEPLDKNIYMRGFLKDIYLRPSCHSCPSKRHTSGSDITIADYWGIQNVLPEFNDDKGVSLVIVNNIKGKTVLGNLDIESVETSYAVALKGNPSIAISVKVPAYREEFFENIDKDMMGTLQKQLHLPFHTRLARFVKIRLRTLRTNKKVKQLNK